MNVEIVYADPAGATRVALVLDAGATVGEAVAASGLVATLALDPSVLSFAIFGRRAVATTPVGDGDRVELLRALIVDPQEARRRRAEKRLATGRVKNAGLPPSRR